MSVKNLLSKEEKKDKKNDKKKEEDNEIYMASSKMKKPAKDAKSLSNYDKVVNHRRTNKYK
jgi:hypothetical protein